MKNFLLLAALVLAAVSIANAQERMSDTVINGTRYAILGWSDNNQQYCEVTVMDPSVADINRRLRLHSQMAVSAFVMAGFSAFSFYRSSVAEAAGPTSNHPWSNTNSIQTDWQKNWKTIGVTTGIIASVLFIASYIPTWTGKVYVNQDGLVFRLDGKRKAYYRHELGKEDE